MGEISLEGSTVNRFVASLSKSIQALCHGCMDFDDSIEMVGYININIDRGKIVDCVLNEKVLRSTSNSMTVVSNSFHAKKEKPKETKDSSCSPIPQNELNPHLSSNKRQFSRGRDLSHRGSGYKRARYNPKQMPASSYEQHSTTSSDNYYHSQTSGDSSNYANPEQTTSNYTNPEQTTVKSEAQDNGDYDPSTSSQGVSVKTEAMGESLTETAPEDQENRLDSAKAEMSTERSEKDTTEQSPCEPSTAEQSYGGADDYGNEENSQQFETGGDQSENYPLESQNFLEDQASHSRQSYSDNQGESSSQGAQFEVIEIGDDDEDMQEFFDQTEEDSHHAKGRGHSNQFGGHGSRSSHSDQLSHLSGFEPCVCDICQATFPNRHLQRVHMQQYHTSSFPLKCHLCSKGFHSKRGLDLHVVSHSGRSYPCSVCGRSFYQMGHLTSHLKRIHKCIVCRTCSKMFKIDEFQKHVLLCT